MITWAVLSAILDALVAVLLAQRLWRARHRGASLRLRLFGALATTGLLGALAAGLYAVALDARTIGFAARVASVAPKALVLGSALLWATAAASAIVGRRLARSVELVADAASRIAQGERSTRLPAVRDGETRSIVRALASLRKEAETRPYAAAFLRDAWHDLKTPLAAIRATVEVLEDGALDDPAAARRFVANVSRAAQDLDRMLGDLVMLARMETATLAPTHGTALGPLVARALARIGPLAAARGVTLRGEQSVGAGRATVPCDAAAIARVLSNLLENAVDATPGGDVRVSIDTGSRGAVIVDVVNEPCAVPHALRDHLFERTPASSTGRGSGLGLAIARAAVEAHGGHMRFVELGPPRVRVRVELPR